MHGFKGSGGIEYDANAAMVIRRDPDEEEDGLGRPVMVEVQKNRWGSTTGRQPVRLLFDGAHNMIASQADMKRYKSR
jgi:replicative DNA helicase